MNVTGHLFLIIRGDLLHLRYDAFLAVTDTAGNDSRRHWLAGHTNFDPVEVTRSPESKPKSI